MTRRGDGHGHEAAALPVDQLSMRRILAAIVYTICLEDCEGSIYSIDFCWQICFHELTYNKHQSVQRSHGASIEVMQLLFPPCLHYGIMDGWMDG